MSITEDQALQMINAALHRANELGVKIAVSVVDTTAALVATIRMAGASFQWLNEGATGKAMASILWRGQPSAALAEHAGSPIFGFVNSTYQGKLLYAKGAVPVRQGEQIIGAIGVAGASQEEDEDIATAGAAALGDV